MGARRLLPLMLDLNSKQVVIFGGGGVSERKARLFSDYSRVRVVALDFAPGLQELKDDVELISADLRSGFERYLEGAFIVIPATSDSELNRAIEHEAARRGILVNRVEGAGDVVVPSIIRKESVTIAISTDVPALSKYLRLRLEKQLPGNYQQMALLLKRMRPELKASVSGQKERARIIWDILEDEEVWRLLEISYEKAYMRARLHASPDERDSLDAGDPPQGIHR